MRELKFGIEIEFFGIYNGNMRNILIANGINCGLRGWQFKYDGSVSHEGNELVSPILYGDEGLKEVEKVLNLMKNNGCKVNRTCGIHIHHDVADYNLQDFKSLCKFMYNNQKVFDALMTKSRRDNNHYCQPLSLEDLKNIDEENITPRNLRSKVNRYRTLNVAAYAAHGTVEFRQHYGCLDSEKVLNWIELTFRCVDYAKDKTIEIHKNRDLKETLFQFRKDLNLFNTPLSKFMSKRMKGLRVAV